MRTKGNHVDAMLLDLQVGRGSVSVRHPLRRTVNRKAWSLSANPRNELRKIKHVQGHDVFNVTWRSTYESPGNT